MATALYQRGLQTIHAVMHYQNRLFYKFIFFEAFFIYTTKKSRTKKTFTVKGIEINGIARNATITIQRHPKTSTVRWDIGRLDDFDCTSQAMNNRLEKAGMVQAISQWRQRHIALLSRREFFYQCNRWSFFKYLPNRLADELAAIVLEHYEAAVIDLPTEEDWLAPT
jgi:hypothetical protein